MSKEKSKEEQLFEKAGFRYFKPLPDGRFQAEYTDVKSPTTIHIDVFKDLDGARAFLDGFRLAQQQTNLRYNLGMKYFDRDGRPIEFLEWMRLRQDNEYAQVALDKIGSRTVSTVWLGVSSFLWRESDKNSSPQAIFETMVFPDLSCQKYSTLAEAKAGHQKIVNELLALPEPESGSSD